MVKTFVETIERTGWQGFWACACDKKDFEKYSSDERFILFHPTAPSDLGQSIDRIFNQPENGQ